MIHCVETIKHVSCDPSRKLYEIHTDTGLHVFNLIANQDQYTLFKQVMRNPDLFFADKSEIDQGPPRLNRKPCRRLIEMVEPGQVLSCKPREQIYHLRLKRNREYVCSFCAKPEDYVRLVYLLKNPERVQPERPLVLRGRPKRGAK